MRTAGISYFNLDPRLTLTFAVLIALILGGNALVISQFNIARNETARLTGANEQLVAVLQLQANLLSFDRRLDDLVRSVDLRRFLIEADSLRETLRRQTKQTRTAIANLPPGTVVDPAFSPTLDTIDVTLPSELEAILELAKSGDRASIPPRMNTELNAIETQTAILVNSINEQASRELAQGVAEMRNVQRRILVIVPATALSTFFIAAFFGWSIARRMIELRFDERVNERTRIARDLHDTLLQSLHGLLLNFQRAANLLPERPAEAKQRLEGAIDQAAQAITESRDAVQGLRSSTVVTNDLAVAIQALGEELAAKQTSENPPLVHVAVEGTPRDLNPILRDDVYRIAGEALRNAFQHAQAHHIEVEVRYDERQLRLRIRDDGNGVAPDVSKTKGRAGHWGFQGMRERAKLAGGQLEIWSELKSGTEIELSIPGSSAYIDSSPRQSQKRTAV